MKKRITVVGAAAVGDYIFHVDHLPEMGEIVRVTTEPQPLVLGGCAPNISAGMAALGQIEPILHYPVGDDAETQEVLKEWDSRGINCKLTVVPGCVSGRSWMFMQDDGTTMCFAYPGAAGEAAAGNCEMEEWILVAPVLNQFTKAYLDAAVKDGKKIAVTGIGSRELVPYLEKLCVLVINRLECASLCAGAGCGSAQELSCLYPDLFLYVTNGSKGSSLYRGGQEDVIPTVQATRLVDFTGAGDSYTAGVMSSLLAGYDPVDAGWLGAAVASYVVAEFGGMDKFPTWDMLFQCLEEQFGRNIPRSAVC